MFILRRLLIPVVILAALFIGGSVYLESFAEGQLAGGLRSTLKLPSKPHVQMNAFPIILRVLQGRIPSISIEARDFTVEGLDVEDLSVEMEGVHASLDTLIRSNRFDLEVEKLDGSARITEEAINTYLKAKGSNARTTLRADSSVLVAADEPFAGRRHHYESTGHLVLEGRKLTFRSERVTVDGQPVPPGPLADFARRQTTYSVDIPPLPGNILPSKVEVTTATLRFVVALAGYRLKLD